MAVLQVSLHSHPQRRKEEIQVLHITSHLFLNPSSKTMMPSQIRFTKASNEIYLASVGVEIRTKRETSQCVTIYDVESRNETQV